METCLTTDVRKFMQSYCQANSSGPVTFFVKQEGVSCIFARVFGRYRASWAPVPIYPVGLADLPPNFLAGALLSFFTFLRVQFLKRLVVCYKIHPKPLIQTSVVIDVWWTLPPASSPAGESCGTIAECVASAEAGLSHMILEHTGTQAEIFPNLSQLNLVECRLRMPCALQSVHSAEFWFHYLHQRLHVLAIVTSVLVSEERNRHSDGDNALVRVPLVQPERSFYHVLHKASFNICCVQNAATFLRAISFVWACK